MGDMYSKIYRCLDTDCKTFNVFNTWFSIGQNLNTWSCSAPHPKFNLQCNAAGANAQKVGNVVVIFDGVEMDAVCLLLLHNRHIAYHGTGFGRSCKFGVLFCNCLCHLSTDNGQTLHGCSTTPFQKTRNNYIGVEHCHKRHLAVNPVQTSHRQHRKQRTVTHVSVNTCNTGVSFLCNQPLHQASWPQPQLARSTRVRYFHKSTHTCCSSHFATSRFGNYRTHTRRGQKSATMAYLLKWMAELCNSTVWDERLCFHVMACRFIAEIISLQNLGDVMHNQARMPTIAALTDFA